MTRDNSTADLEQYASFHARGQHSGSNKFSVVPVFAESSPGEAAAATS